MEANSQTYQARAENELTEHLVYHKLAAQEKNSHNREILEKLSAQEKKHYEFWQSLIPGVSVGPRTSTLTWLPLLRRILGVTFTTKYLEQDEKESIEAYKSLRETIPASHKNQLEEIIKEEESHEKALIAELKEARISYIGFIALGLADAIVEITGVHAGFLGVTGSTLIAGISGVIVGFAAAISMGSAAYLQAKQDPEKSPIVSGITTWASYFCSVILLAFPYFLITTMITAFAVSSLIGIALLASFTYFGAVVFDRPFLREFGESVGLMLGTALATYLLGTAVGRIFHISEHSF